MKLAGNVLTGASLTAVMLSWNVSLAVAEPSLAVTLRSMIPLKSSGGVPEKVCVTALNVSQPGNALPSPSVAV